MANTQFCEKFRRAIINREEIVDERIKALQAVVTKSKSQPLRDTFNSLLKSIKCFVLEMKLMQEDSTELDGSQRGSSAAASKRPAPVASKKRKAPPARAPAPKRKGARPRPKRARRDADDDDNERGEDINSSDREEEEEEEEEYDEVDDEGNLADFVQKDDMPLKYAEDGEKMPRRKFTEKRNPEEIRTERHEAATLEAYVRDVNDKSYVSIMNSNFYRVHAGMMAETWFSQVGDESNTGCKAFKEKLRKHLEDPAVDAELTLLPRSKMRFAKCGCCNQGHDLSFHLHVFCAEGPDKDKSYTNTDIGGNCSEKLSYIFNIYNHLRCASSATRANLSCKPPPFYRDEKHKAVCVRANPDKPSYARESPKTDAGERYKDFNAEIKKIHEGFASMEGTKQPKHMSIDVEDDEDDDDYNEEDADEDEAKDSDEGEEDEADDDEEEEEEDE